MREGESRRESLQNLVVDLRHACQIQPPQAGELAHFPTIKADKTRHEESSATRSAAKKHGRRGKEQVGTREGAGREEKEKGV